MLYHARISYAGGKDDFAINLTRDQLFFDVALPFIAGQVVELPLRNGIQLINMKAVTRLTLYHSDSTMDETRFYDPHEESVKDCTAAILTEVRSQVVTPDFKSVLERAFSSAKPQAFIIMKFGDKHLDSAYKGVVKPVFADFGIKTLRIDEVQNAGKITDQMLDEIASSKLVYADLSGERPNCYYETGFAHALGKHLILSIRKPDEIHFDLRPNRFIVWETELELRSNLITRLAALLAPTKSEAGAARPAP